MTLEQGRIQTYTIQPDQGYNIQDVLIDGLSKGQITSYALIADMDHVITARFLQIPIRTIHGTVMRFDAPQTGLSQYWVEAWQKDSFIAGALSDKTGAYTITDMTVTDQIIVSVWPTEDNAAYQGEYYSGQTS